MKKYLSLVFPMVLSSAIAQAPASVKENPKVSDSKSLSTLQQTIKQDYVSCGINTGIPGFSYSDAKGNWSGFDVDFCRATAAALFNDPTRVKFVPLSSKTRFTALSTGEIDLLYRNSTWTYTRDNTLGISFLGVNYYDGQGFITRKSNNINDIKELNGATICITPGTTTELNLADYFSTHNLTYKPLVVETTQQGSKAYEAKRCDAYSADYSALHGIRTMLPNPDDHMILKEIISKEPLGPWVRNNDTQWIKINKWILIALKNAEELGITSKNVTDLVKSDDIRVQRLLGSVNLPATESLGLNKHWALHMIKHSGNYGEILDRNLGPKTPLSIARGLNKLWTQGGLIYGPPIR